MSKGASEPAPTPRCATCGQWVADLEARFCPHDGTPLDGGAPWRDPLVGTTLDGRYRILLRIGQGGFAVVYQARHERLGIDVAVKMLRPELARDPQLLARFAQEARTSSRVDHENVVRVMDFGCAALGMHYLVMEYVSGTSLDVELAQLGVLPPLRTAHIAAQLAAGLARAHALGVVHRDVKPENVMLVRRGANADFVKVLDFGIASAPQAQRMTKPGEMLGTAHYMAPEQWSGEADARTDVYALGALMLEMLTGAPPFEGNVMALCTRHISEPAPLPTSRVPSLRAGAGFDDLIGRCLAKAPQERFQTMDEVLAVIGRLWGELGRPSGRLTYAHTAAAPRTRADLIPDATVYQSVPLDVVWDGALLCDEIRRLHLLRSRRLDELASVLWSQGWPPEARALRDEAVVLEEAIERHGEEVALSEARLEELWQQGREKEAVLRLAVIDANLAMAAALDRLPDEVIAGVGIQVSEEPAPAPRSTLSDDPWHAATEPTVPRGHLVPGESSADAETRSEGATARLRRADQSLATHYRRQQQAEASLRARIESAVRELGKLETRVGPLHERLAAIVRRESSRRPGARAAVMAFAQVDGALAAYQALLEALETMSEE